jgi:hypothetical protein
MVMRAKYNVYHLECFACFACQHRWVQKFNTLIGFIYSRIIIILYYKWKKGPSTE